MTTLISPAERRALRATSRVALLETSDGPLPLQAVSVRTVIDGLIATTHYTQRFVNPTNGHVEVTYVFPLPPRAAVTELVATLGTRRIEGIIKERQAARQDYATALAQSQRAALVETDRPDVFSSRIGNLAPGETAIIELTVTGPLAVEDSEATFRFPLLVAPRYVTGTPLDAEPSGSGLAPDTDAVPDASRLNPPRLTESPPTPELTFVVDVHYPGLDRASLTTSHSMRVRASGQRLILTMSKGARMDRDALVRFSLPRELTMNAVVLDDPDSNATGTWSLTVVAPPHESSRPRDVVCLLDRSGSMGGWKMAAARRATARLIDSLTAADRFCVVAFDDAMEAFRPEESLDQSTFSLTPATDRHRFGAVTWLSQVHARGGTEMATPVVGALDLLAGSPDRERVVILVTDGQIAAEAHLLASIESRLGATRFCVVGIDSAPNASLLERLGRYSNGFVALVESEDRLDVALRTLHRRVGRPDLLSVHVELDGAEMLDTTAPSRPLDVFAGVPCVVSGRFSRPGTAIPSLRVRAERADGSASLDQLVVPSVSRERGVKDVWARALVADLEDLYDARGRDDVRERIIQVSTDTGVLSRFTAFVAVDRETQEITSTEEITQPVDTPAGWGTFNGVAQMRGGPRSAMLARSTLAAGPLSSLVPTATTSRFGEADNVYVTSATSDPAAVTGVSPDLARPLLEEIARRLADSTRHPVVADLVRRLGRLRSTNPLVIVAHTALIGFLATTVSREEALVHVRAALVALDLAANIPAINHPTIGAPRRGPEWFGR